MMCTCWHSSISHPCIGSSCSSRPPCRRASPPTGWTGSSPWRTRSPSCHSSLGNLPIALHFWKNCLNKICNICKRDSLNIQSTHYWMETLFHEKKFLILILICTKSFSWIILNSLNFWIKSINITILKPEQKNKSPRLYPTKNLPLCGYIGCSCCLILCHKLPKVEI